MTRVTKTLLCNAGFTFVETMTAMFVLIVGLLGVATMADFGNHNTAGNLARESATNLAREIVERSREIPYSTLVADANNHPAPLMALSGLGTSGSSGTWKITDRRNVTFTVTAKVCEIDDKSDGIGARDLTYCDMSSSGGAGGSNDGGAGSTYTAVYADLTALGINTGVTLSGTGATPVCNLLGANPTLNTLLGGTASLVTQGADVSVCGSSSSTQVAYDRNPDDFKRVTVDLSWSRGSVRQTTLIPNPANGAPIT